VAESSKAQFGILPALQEFSKDLEREMGTSQGQTIAPTDDALVETSVRRAGPDMFPFELLPAELRWMVYENMPADVPRRLPLPGMGELFCDDIEVELLQTCRAINAEARQPLQRRRRDVQPCISFPYGNDPDGEKRAETFIHLRFLIYLFADTLLLPHNNPDALAAASARRFENYSKTIRCLFDTPATATATNNRRVMRAFWRRTTEQLCHDPTLTMRVFVSDSYIPDIERNVEWEVFLRLLETSNQVSGIGQLQFKFVFVVEAEFVELCRSELIAEHSLPSWITKDMWEVEVYKRE